MRSLTFAATFIGMFFGAIGGGGAEAAPRCAQGKIFRPSLGVCQTIGKAKRAGVRVYRARYAKASIRHRVKKNRAPIVRRVDLARVSAYPPPTPPWAQRTPIVDGFAPETIAPSPFGVLAPMPETPTSWALRNGEAVQ